VVTNIQIPIVEKNTGQVVSVNPTMVQLMDLESYEIFDVVRPDDEELSAKLEPGKDVEYWVIMGRYKIQRVKG
jgi:translation initiation factor 5A